LIKIQKGEPDLNLNIGFKQDPAPSTPPPMTNNLKIKKITILLEFIGEFL
jgi:hypothetical protein